MNQDLLQTATTNIADILNFSLKHDSSMHKSLIMYDTQNGLTQIITQAYSDALPQANKLDFDTLTREEAIASFDALQPGDLVVLIQTSNFRLNDFRIRLQLFDRGLHVIEHAHLYRNDESVWDVYVDSLAYDPNWYHTQGQRIKNTLESSSCTIISRNDNQMTISGALEVPKLNIGDYSGMSNVGGSYPIGEVFTEAKQLESVNGTLEIYAFADTTFELHMYEPFNIEVTNGLITGWSENTPQTFCDLIDHIRSIERPILREIGFGLNKAISRERHLGDITAFERNLGLHVSIGEKHSVYAKEGISKSKSRFHVDLYLNVDTVTCDNHLLYAHGEYC
jgi:aminopeptidase